MTSVQAEQAHEREEAIAEVEELNDDVGTMAEKEKAAADTCVLP